jgi:hypothetical protein
MIAQQQCWAFFVYPPYQVASWVNAFYCFLDIANCFDKNEPWAQKTWKFLCFSTFFEYIFTP